MLGYLLRHIPPGLGREVERCLELNHNEAARCKALYLRSVVDDEEFILPVLQSCHKPPRDEKTPKEHRQLVTDHLHLDYVARPSENKTSTRDGVVHPLHYMSMNYSEAYDHFITWAMDFLPANKRAVFKMGYTKWREILAQDAFWLGEIEYNRQYPHWCDCTRPTGPMS